MNQRWQWSLRLLMKTLSRFFAVYAVKIRAAVAEG
jgi:hypothetical protein